MTQTQKYVIQSQNNQWFVLNLIKTLNCQHTVSIQFCSDASNARNFSKKEADNLVKVLNTKIFGNHQIYKAISSIKIEENTQDGQIIEIMDPDYVSRHYKLTLVK